jgi:hypothetical protein
MLTVSNSFIFSNSADFGAGIFNDGVNGGSATLTVIASTFSENAAVTSGGGIFNDGASGGSARLAVSSSAFGGNLASSGGGIYNNGTSSGSAILSVSTSTFNGNSAALDSGGGIVNDGSSSGNATLMVVASTLRDNSANNFGGGIYNNGTSSGSATLTVSASTLSTNSAAEFAGGGGIFNDGRLGSAALMVSASTLSGNSAEDGGGIVNDQGTLEIGDTILNAGVAGSNLRNFSGTVTSRGYNLSSDDAGGGAGTEPGGLLNGTADQRNSDPLLGPLQIMVARRSRMRSCPTAPPLIMASAASSRPCRWTSISAVSPGHLPALLFLRPAATAAISGRLRCKLRP